ncbi:MAG: 3-hydroxyanthranilate 3,4-dioxygenase [Acidimicrobiales bacterium]
MTDKPSETPDPTVPIDVTQPFDLMAWVAEHRHELVPPVANKQVWADERMIVMIVGGGNVRSDYHDDPREEFFLQLRGDMILKVRDPDGGAATDLIIAEGNVHLLPPHVRHSPQRPDLDSVGLVVEYQREPGELDGFEWYCANCNSLVHRVEVQLEHIDRDLPPLFEAFHASEAARTCDVCGTLHP